MAVISLTILQEHVPRLKLALLQEFVENGIESPTDQEYLIKAKTICMNALRSKIRRYENKIAKQEAISIIEDIDIT